MGNFCKGVLLGMISGVVIGSVIVSKNENLSQKVRNGYDKVSNMFTKTKNQISNKLKSKQENPDTSGEQAQQNTFEIKNSKN